MALTDTLNTLYGYNPQRAQLYWDRYSSRYPNQTAPSWATPQTSSPTMFPTTPTAPSAMPPIMPTPTNPSGGMPSMPTAPQPPQQSNVPTAPGGSFNFSNFSGASTGTGSNNPYFGYPGGTDPFNPFATGQPTSPIGSIYLNRTTQRPAYTIATAPYGGGFDPFSQFVQNNYGRAVAGYEAALAYDPNLLWTDYLQQMGGEQFFRNQWNQLSPRMRGENASMFAPPARWQLR